MPCPTSSDRVLSYGGDGMSRSTLFDHVCCSKAVISCHARRLSIVCAALRRLWHATPDVVRPCVLPKGDDGMPRPTSFDRFVQAKGNDGMPRPTLFHRVCCPKVMMSCHARRHSIVCAAQRR